MKKQMQALIIAQTERNLKHFQALKTMTIPPKGWIYTIRTALKMSLRQLANRLNIAPQSLREIEKREENASISIRSLRQTAAALNMKLVYGFVCQYESLEQMIEARAFEIAKEIVLRSDLTMKLEDQQNSEERIKKAIEQKTAEIKDKMPKYLWD